MVISHVPFESQNDRLDLLIMRFIDRFLQEWRARVVRPWVFPKARVLDIGCHQGEFLKSLGPRVGLCVGLDPIAVPCECPGLQILGAKFQPPTPFHEASFDCIVFLASLEHIFYKDHVASECFRLLATGGRVIITVPSIAVDWIVMVLQKLNLASGMSLEEHHGFPPLLTRPIFERQGFTLEKYKTFQLGLNHLFVFRKPKYFK